MARKKVNFKEFMERLFPENRDCPAHDFLIMIDKRFQSIDNRVRKLEKCVASIKSEMKANMKWLSIVIPLMTSFIFLILEFILKL